MADEWLGGAKSKPRYREILSSSVDCHWIALWP